ncbi:(deoxy)nucleoside triphosphate pyrophosphohydrolase [Tannockella kyphosi]|uniref:(deoxy)nucleoside triphosphate pyrophosphohydrolase n=1 Tax=Tannockella kyphosi TaxID=2899121 RepID=UPI002012204A|nr:(deoxy)nucleoside triphosphate pyrophosphohydrolase [Tannockella kyphosi]
MKEIQVVAAIIENNGKILATQRGYGDYKGFYEFPGGKIEANESKEEALVREIQEELNVVIEVGEHLICVEYDYPAFHLKMDCFFSKIVQGNIQLLEHLDAKWLSKQQYDTVPWLEADIEIIELLKRR